MILALQSHKERQARPLQCLWRPWLPTSVRGGAVIDGYGDAIMNCKHLPSDTSCHRHDTGKLAIVNECVHAGLVHDCEVYGLFADLIPAQAMAQGQELQWGGRGRG